jgi:trans-AT polyketide synthase, acyltransferase and oxidoreductase domains
MANGISSERLVIAAARAGLLAFFGAAGLGLDRIGQAIGAIRQALDPETPFGSSLLHDIHDPDHELAVVNFYLQQQIHCLNASAFTSPTPAVVLYRARGLQQRPDGEIVAPNRLFAKVSREEVARQFLEPAPPAMLERLVADGRLDPREAELARQLPLVDDLTGEADSGGHTDKQSLVALLPTLLALRDEIVARRGYARPPRIGAAGGLGTPSAVAAAFSLGAEYVLTGSINQACVESGTSPQVRALLAAAGPADVALGLAADSFEMGSQVQVLRKGTLFAARSRRLHELYRRYSSLDEIPASERQTLESTYFRASLEQVWSETEAYFRRVNPAQLERAERDPHHRLALVLRWYLGLSSVWAQQGVEERRADFQIWCGPAMGAFNAWVRGSFLEELERRQVVEVAENLMHGAAATLRAQWLALQGTALPSGRYDFRPRPLGSTAAAINGSGSGRG